MHALCTFTALKLETLTDVHFKRTSIDKLQIH